MNSAAIVVTDLSKDYGSFPALRNVNLSVFEGEVFGFLGPNGAGKTTTIRILLDLMRPTSGSVSLFGADPRNNPELRSRIGYLPGELSLPPRKTARHYLGYLARLRKGRGFDAIEHLAQRFRLDLDKPVRSMSKGNKQKVGVLQAFMHSPELLILDEPTSGLDPLLQHEFLQMVREHANRGATVFMSSHVLKEVEEIAGRVAILRGGELIDVDTVEELRRRAGQEVSMSFSHEISRQQFESIKGVENLVVSGNTMTCKLSGDPADLIKAASQLPHDHVAGKGPRA